MDLLNALGGFDLGGFDLGGIANIIPNALHLLIDPEGFIAANQPGETSSIVVNSSGSSQS